MGRGPGRSSEVTTGGPAAPDRRSTDRPVAASPFPRLPADPQQRALPGGQEARAEDVSVERLAPEVRELLRAEIAAARGRDVSFVACLDANGLIVDARVVARGTVDAVLALPGIAVRGELLLHNHPSGVLEPSGADLSVAARLHDGGVGFAIVDNEVTDCYVVVECPRPRATTRIDPIDVAALLSPSGPVARALGSFEDRPSQRDIAAYVSDLYNDGGVGMLEAGTGVGDSLFEDERRAELDGLAAWAARTSDGSLADLTDEPSGEVWDAVAAESDLCTRLKCPHFDRCFLFQARRRAAEADVVVVNHHLLASDLGVRMASDNWQEAAVLPPYRRLVLDEAHHLEDVAAMHLGAQVSMLGVQRLLSRLEKNGRGLLPTLRSALFRRDDLLSAASRELTQQSLVDALAAARRAADDVFTRLARRLDGEPGPAPVLRLSDGFLTDAVWDEGLGVALDNLLLAFSRLSEGAAMIADRLSLDDPSERRAPLVGELRGVVRRLDAAAAGLTATLRPPAAGPAAVRWLERRGRKTPNVSLAAVPLDLAPVLKQNLFDRTETVVLTSATLAAGGDFGYLEERLGLDLPPARTKVREIHASPFDYASQCLFGIPTDLPEPRA